MRGTLRVPSHIRALESELKKEWDANDRKAKRVLSSGAPRGGKKRKADDEVPDSMNQGGGVTYGV